MTKKESFSITILKNLKAIDSHIKILKHKTQKYVLSTHNCYENSVDEPAFNQILKIMQKSKNASLLLEMRNAVVDGANLLEKTHRLILVLVFVRQVQKDKIAKHFGISLRTLYRHLETAKSCFAQKMNTLGFTEKWFAELYAQLNENHSTIEF